MEFKAHYKDENHDCDIIIESQKVQNNNDTFTKCQDNTYWELNFTLDGITFVGMEFTDFEIENPNDYETAKGNLIYSNGETAHSQTANITIIYRDTA